MRVSSRSYQFRMALNTWHVWQYVIGIDITLSPSRMYTAFFYGGYAKATVCGLLMARNRL